MNGFTSYLHSPMTVSSDLQMMVNLGGSCGTSIRKTSFHVYPDFLIEVSTLAVNPNEMLALISLSESLTEIVWTRM